MRTGRILLMLLMALILCAVVGYASAEQNAMWFMDDMNFTQEPGGGYSHAGTLNFDVKGVNNRNIKAPFDATIVEIFTGYNAGNTVIIQSNAPVKYANGTVDYMSMAIAHDNDISDCWVGRTLSQGEVYLQNGDYGIADGIHSHVTMISGKYTDHSGWLQVSTGNWTFKSAINPVDALFISDSTNIYSTAGLSFKKAVQSQYLDVNGYLDGVNSGNLGSYGTCDVYVNGSKVADDVNDYCAAWPVGTSYRIDDIRAKDGYKYEKVQSGSLSGTVGTSRVEIYLNFTSYATLDVKGYLDSAISDTTSGFGTFDVYINGSLAAEGVNDYNAKFPQGTTYEIKNIQALEGKYYNGMTSGSPSGTLGKGVTNPTLSFSTKLEPGPDWQEVSEMPGYIDTSVCEIEYNNKYSRTATSSPGLGWTQVAGSGVTTYQNSGSVEETYIPRSTSNTYQLVGTYYYHYCASNGRVNYQPDGTYNLYSGELDVNAFDVIDETGDDDSADIRLYQLRWKQDSANYAGALAWCQHGNSCWYYRMYRYQPKVAVTNYTWTKDGGWTTEKDADATSVRYRFRLKSYDVVYDANGGDDAPESAVKFHDVDLTLADTEPTRKGYVFKGWNTAADGKGDAYKPGGTYTGNVAVTLYAQWTAAQRFVLPTGLTTIADEAFRGIDAVIIVVPDGCKSIGSMAFADNAALEQIYIPASVTNVSFDAFDGCVKATVYGPEDSTAIRLAARLGIPYEVTD